MSIDEHPVPLTSTVKQLYAFAFRCAHPDCQRPLYKISDENGDRVLNSRVSHIHARSKGGPRWKEMPTKENRSFDNLLLLCIEHSYEIDDNEAAFSAVALREWKAQQLEEYDRIQRNWVISEDEAVEALIASEAYAALHAPSTVELVRRVEALKLAAARTRKKPAAHAAHWNAVRERTRTSIVAFDGDGKRLYAEPSAAEVRPIQESIVISLREAQSEVERYAEQARVELAAVEVTKPEIAPWAQSLEDAIIDVVDRTGMWTAKHDVSADHDYFTSTANLTAAVDLLVRASRGEPVSPPVSLMNADASSETAERNILEEHQSLLEEARPFVRVSHLPYNADLRRRLVRATETATAIPFSSSFLGSDLVATAAITVAIGRNAPEAERRRLVIADAECSLVAAAALLHEHASLDPEGDSDVTQLARNLTSQLWSATDWTEPSNWQECIINGRLTLGFFAHEVTHDAVRTRLGDTLTTHPRLLEDVVRATAPWSETLHWSGESAPEYVRRHRDIPGWFPIETVRHLAANVIDGDLPNDNVELLNRILDDSDANSPGQGSVL